MLDRPVDRKALKIESEIACMEAALATFKRVNHSSCSDGASATAIYLLAKDIEGALSCMIEAVGGDPYLDEFMTKTVDAALQDVWNAEYPDEYPEHTRACDASDRQYQAAKERAA